MIKLKIKEEIGIMKEGGRRLREVVKELIPQIKAGITTKQIDNKAEKLIIKMGGEASFKKVKGYFWSTCLPLNEQIVHTPPSDRVLKECDVLTVDIGMYYKGFHTDFADTIAIGKVSEDVTKFLQTGRKTLDLAIKKTKKESRIGEISQTIQKEVGKAGYSIVKELTGHGVGRNLHEDPYIPGFLDRPVENTLIIKPGLVIAIEIIYAMGNGKMEYEENDDWSIRTTDKSLSACFEHTVAVTDGGSIILT
ncbi:type I methionyl aminopeptidase [Candidatus Roizmanbacteria bacterium RIFCSPLOWO2_01_FULL_37_13]|uniref:Methionine aminopeptidase n=1 Tax=Candidatus Roizmanbacteria bacterium RIFCSPHIGHO2_02_FULL_38_11 TaxID=1802039 RepID=A0A1F7H111_9BACT|nr:MAG: type I methionyl aminopeptidase [Candidatus Roizmanbacteria bacterium RIFCSPHIGHO2_02_FULL_38_11]OGK34317.1 MAG: type I methionyl aminopeptidase [Candidatus Roizmanbacteria bacterium RIFCSPHIGHO2_12_FULL_37_9b]OGK40932.1 MAG: type I methionyl aminopeptidase [Candidatus Roizmanbacteria bacterium RIFCSPLOWO2_01_FULL_37_13]